jgi:hypothetical protein
VGCRRPSQGKLGSVESLAAEFENADSASSVVKLKVRARQMEVAADV